MCAWIYVFILGRNAPLVTATQPTRSDIGECTNKSRVKLKRKWNMNDAGWPHMSQTISCIASIAPVFHITRTFPLPVRQSWEASGTILLQIDSGFDHRENTEHLVSSNLVMLQ